MSSEVGQVTPDVAYEALGDGRSALIDVRTSAEFTFVGVPDLRGLGQEVCLSPLKEYPAMQVMPDFAAKILAAAPEAATLYFICRSGGRSLQAAQMVAVQAAEAGRDVVCVNVAEGFEGDPDGNGHRGTVGGWKARGLPWRQS